MSKLYVNEIKEIKLKRIFNVLNFKCYHMIYLSFAAGFIYGIVMLEKGEGSVLLWLGVAALGILSGYFMDMVSCPKSLKIYGDTVEFSMLKSISRKISFGHVHGWSPVRVHYRIEDISNVVFEQNFVERIFDAGHISFSGKVSIEAKRDGDRVRINKKYCIYGIDNFKEFSNELER